MNEDAIEYGQRMQLDSARDYKIRQEVAKQMVIFAKELRREQISHTMLINKLEEQLRNARAVGLSPPCSVDSVSTLPIFFATLIFGGLLGLCIGGFL